MCSSSNQKAGQQKEDGDPIPPPPQSKQEAALNRPKRLWRKALNKLKVVGKQKQRDASTSSQTPEPDTSSPQTQVELLIQLIKADLEHMRHEAVSLNVYNDQLKRDIIELEDVFQVITKTKSETKEAEKATEDWLNRLRKKLMKVKLAIPSKFGADKNKHDEHLNLINLEHKSEKMPHLHNTSVFKTSMEFKDFEARYKELEERARLCLLCFSIFPQGAIVKKRLMLQWWTVEGFASSMEDAQSYFNTLMEKGFIEAVNENRSLSVGSCRIHPLHRAALVMLAERAKLFNFGTRGDPTQSFSGSFQACLMGAGLISYDDFTIKNDKVGEGTDPVKVIKELIQELEKLHLLMNVDEHILEFAGDWFAKMKNLNILYLGRWKALATHHIEVEDPKFLKELGNLKFVKFLSLQGVSNIISLPQSILKLTKLEMLDLRACSNLESIPEKIYYLEKLTHLDMSECYLLAHMPKGLSQLTNLKVLKGFFVSKPKGNNTKSCTLEDLEKLKHLEKLCIYTDHEEFPEEEHVMHLENFQDLTKLTITWGVGNKTSVEPEAKMPKEQGKGKLPPNLKKLDLKCFPMAATPYWLKLENMERTELKKLYIRGGKLRDLGQYQGIDGGDKKWKVEELRLKYLGEIEMEWRQFRGLFPELKYLEKVSCPNLTLFPCDAKGVWINPE